MLKTLTKILIQIEQSSGRSRKN